VTRCDRTDICTRRHSPTRLHGDRDQPTGSEHCSYARELFSVQGKRVAEVALRSRGAAERERLEHAMRLAQAR